MATQTFGLSGAIVNSNKTYSSTDADVTSLLQWASVAYSSLILAQPPTCSFTASITGTTLAVTAVAAGQLAVNQFVFGPGVPAGAYISALGTGGGGPGTYTLSVAPAQTVSSGPLKAYGPDITATGLYQGTMNAWVQAQQKFAKDNNLAAVPTPPPMGWA